MAFEGMLDQKQSARMTVADAYQALLASMKHAKARKRLGLPEDLVIYMARHGFVTRAIKGGTPLARVAKLVGHTHPNTIMTTYYHPDTMAMIKDVAGMSEIKKVVLPGDEGTSPSPGESLQ